jgi:hypothetical protein
MQEDINRDVKWVQNIKDSHGSVELNALQQVEAINTRGKYLVGCIVDNLGQVDPIFMLHHLLVIEFITSLNEQRFVIQEY